MNPLTASRVTKGFTLSPIKSMEIAASKIPGVISLAQGIPSFETPRAIRDFIKEKIDQGACDRYSLTNGLPELREEIALSLQQDGLHYDPESEIIVTVGSIEAITATLLGCTVPGDEVIIPSPTYTSYQGALRLAGCEPIFADLVEENNFDLDLDQIERLITKRTRAIFYCNPNNPTGTIFSLESTKQLLRLAHQHNLLIITDEAYKDYYYTDDQHVTPVALPDARDRVIRICSFSKAFAMTGWRVGFLHTARPIAERILGFHDSMVTCAPVASQYGAIAALRLGKPYIDQFREEYRARRNITLNMLDQMSHVLDYQMPRASYFVFPRIKDTVALAKDSNRLAFDILEKVKLALVPGVAFGPSGESHLRISFGRELHQVEEGMNRLLDYFNDTSKSTRGGLRAVTKSAPPAAPPLLRKFAAQTLSTCAKHYITRTKPLVIGIVGNRGKTVFKRIIADLLSQKLKTRATILSYNTEIGMPLSILGLANPKSSAQRLRFPIDLLVKTLLAGKDCEVLVLEYGIRRIEDAQNLTKIAVPDWLVVTDIALGESGLDYSSIAAGIEHVAALVPSDRILWSGQDPALGKLNATLLKDRSLNCSAIAQGKLSFGTKSFNVKRELPGPSYQLGTLAAAMIATSLGIEDGMIEGYLCETGRNGE